MEQRRSKYTFTVDWFSRHLPVWNEVLMPLRGRPLRALEIGCFEGAATTWLIDNVLVEARWSEPTLSSPLTVTNQSLNPKALTFAHMWLM